MIKWTHLVQQNILCTSYLSKRLKTYERELIDIGHKIYKIFLRHDCFDLSFYYCTEALDCINTMYIKVCKISWRLLKWVDLTWIWNWKIFIGLNYLQIGQKKRLPNAFTMGRQVSRPARHGISGLVDLTYKKNLWHMFNFTIVNRIF